MTGFGIGRAPLGQGHIVVEARSANHRFLEVRARADLELADLSSHVEQLARRQLGRGRYDLVVRTDGVVPRAAAINTALAEAVYESLCALRDRIAPEAEVPFSMLSSVPNVFTYDNCCHDEATMEAVSAALDNALAAANVMRLQEGATLAVDLLERLALLRKHTQLIAGRRSGIVEGISRRLHDRVQRMLKEGGVEVDPTRIAQEVALAADRCDIEEEITRLESHFSQFELMTNEAEPVGRRLDFLLQEMVREINTVGAKSQDASVSHAVVEIKAEIERMREQVQNVE